jgi:predicted nucleic acid-binding protein
LTTVCDTTFLIDHLRGREEAHRRLDDALDRRAPMKASVLSRAEIGTGLVSRQRRAAERLFASVDWIPVTSDIADLAGSLAREYRWSHSTIDLVDYLIAATALSLDAELVTSNLKHFPMFPDLEPPY